MDKFFLVQIKRTNGTIEKGVVVKDSLDAAEQGFHAYLSAYGFDHDDKTDYVQAGIINGDGLHMMGRVWEKQTPTPEPEEEA